MAIPIILFYFSGRRRKLPFRPVLLLFGLFITACGWTHFIGYLTFQTPVYRLDGLVKLLTALVSWFTVLALIPTVPKALAMRSPKELEDEIEARQRAETALKAAHDSLEERVRERTAEIEALNDDLRRSIRETHHRVKNNLQVVSALLEMQMDEGQESLSRSVVQDSLLQIKTIAIVHDLLSQDKTSGEVDVAKVLRNLVPLLSVGLMSADAPVNIQLEAETGPVFLPTKAATGLALIVNELVSNALKHASEQEGPRGYRQGESETADQKDRRKVNDAIITDSIITDATVTEAANYDGIVRGGNGRDTIITVRLSRQPPNRLRLVVADNGAGFPDDFDVQRDGHIGLELVCSIVANDLQGELTVDNAGLGEEKPGGARITVVFPEHPDVE